MMVAALANAAMAKTVRMDRFVPVFFIAGLLFDRPDLCTDSRFASASILDHVVGP
jgi:hypothetical protein